MSQPTIQAESPLRQVKQLLVERFPDECPCCHKGIEPNFKLAFVNIEEPEREPSTIQAVFQCTWLNCRRFFIAYYRKERLTGEMLENHHKLIKTRPREPVKKEFPQPVAGVSEMFVTIYNATNHAEQLGLSSIVGPGYRKALEFLIKDFLISEEPAKKEQIEKMYLQNAIQEKIQDENLKVCAERAAWLGNDETHYLKKWTDKDINDLKVLITLSVNWIHSHLLTKKYKKEMPEGKK